MTREEHAIHMLGKIKERIDKCEPMSIVLITQASEFIEDSYNNREINQDTFQRIET